MDIPHQGQIGKISEFVKPMVSAIRSSSEPIYSFDEHPIAPTKKEGFTIINCKIHPLEAVVDQKSDAMKIAGEDVERSGIRDTRVNDLAHVCGVFHILLWCTGRGLPG